jgi:hypothetical protein
MDAMIRKIQSMILVFSIILSSSIQAQEGANSDSTTQVPTLEFKSEPGAVGSPEVEMINLLPRTETEDALAIKYVAEEMAKNGNSQRSIVTVNLADDGASKATAEQTQKAVIEKIGLLTAANSQEIKIHEVQAEQDFVNKMNSGGLKSFFQKHERLSLSLLRTTVNGTIVSLGLILNAGLPPLTAVSIGLLTGSMSGTAQFFNPHLQRLLEGNVENNQRLISQGKVGRAKVKVFQLARWFALEASIYTIIDAFSYGVGVPMGGITEEALKVVKSSLMATASQGIWDATIATETRESLRRSEGDPAAQSRIQARSNVITFGVSMVSVFGGILTLMGSNLGSWALGALGVAGALYSGRNYLKQRLAQAGTRVNFSVSSCRQIFAF